MRVFQRSKREKLKKKNHFYWCANGKCDCAWMWAWVCCVLWCWVD